ncbi:Ger(x)C family spore germination protein [Alkalihalobacillus sp. 1P02AB]|uniref:Ger(x)C family spore germination protein n=1 Tax=Alkalihalobacillus sp. 1P02AB TaxID=3132260 RepID=UPI0039A42393
MTSIMNRGRAIRPLILFIAVLILISGCTRARIIDDVKIIQSIGYDLEDEQIIGTGSYVIYEDSIDDSLPEYLFTAESSTAMGILSSFTSQATDIVDIMQLSSIVISEQFAESGIQDLLINFNSEPSIGTNSRLVISNQRARSFLEKGMNYPPYYLSSILEQNMRFGKIPFSNLHTVTYQHYSKGQDIYMPIMEIINERVFQVKTVGVFKNDKLILRLNETETLLLKILVDDFRGNSADYEFSTNDNKDILIKIENVKRNTTVKDSNINPEVIFNIKIKVLLKEQVPNIAMEVVNNRITAEIETHLESELVSLLNKLKKEEVDPVGNGELFRATQRTWDHNEFYEQVYPNLTFRVNAEVNIVNTGVRK